MSANIFKRSATGAIRIAAFSLCLVSAAPGTEHGDGRRIEIDLADYRFSPEPVEVVVGEPVELVLTDRDVFTPHNLSLSAPGAGMDIDVDVQPGKSVTVSFTPTEPGTYEFYCDKKLPFFKSHRERGMEGRVLVKAP